jgi:hypothetical protein
MKPAYGTMPGPIHQIHVDHSEKESAFLGAVQRSGDFDVRMVRLTTRIGRSLKTLMSWSCELVERCISRGVARRRPRETACRRRSQEHFSGISLLLVDQFDLHTVQIFNEGVPDRSDRARLDPLDRSAIGKCCGRDHQHEGADAGNVLHHLSTLMPSPR